MAQLYVTDGLTEALPFLENEFVTLHLYTNNLDPTATNVIGDFIEPTFTGYLPQAVPGWGATTNPTSDSAEGVSNLVLFGPETDHSSTTVYGWFVTDGGGALVAAGLFPLGPYTVDDTNPALVVNIDLTLENA